MIEFAKRGFGAEAGSPVRILRNAETCESAVRGLFPARSAEEIECINRKAGAETRSPLVLRVWRRVGANGFVARKRFPAKYAEKVWPEGKA